MNPEDDNGMSRDSSPPVFRVDDLLSWVELVLRRLGMSADDARTGAAVVVDADLRGIHTHGLSNFVGHWHYAPGLDDGSVNATPTVEVLRESSVTAAWDADRGFGPVIAHRAMTDAITRAETHGIGTVTVRDGCHFGTAGHFARMAADRGLLGMVMAHTAASAVPPGARVPLVGTNPMAFAAPVIGGTPLVFDMAVTAAAGTKVQVALREGQPVPPGWIVDTEGKPTTDPSQSGGLLLLGAGPDGGGHKGYGLGLMVDIFSGLLSGTGSGLFTSFGPDWRIGYWFAAWRIDAFVDREQFDQDMRRMVDAIHAAGSSDNPVTVPGERSQALLSKHMRLGVPVAPAVVEQCRRWGEKTGHPFPQPIGDQ